MKSLKVQIFKQVQDEVMYLMDIQKWPRKCNQTADYSPVGLAIPTSLGGLNKQSVNLRLAQAFLLPQKLFVHPLRPPQKTGQEAVRWTKLCFTAAD